MFNDLELNHKKADVCKFFHSYASLLTKGKITRHREEEEEDQGDHRGSGEGQRERGGATQEKRGEGAGRRGMSEHLANMTKFDVNFL